MAAMLKTDQWGECTQNNLLVKTYCVIMVYPELSRLREPNNAPSRGVVYILFLLYFLESGL